MHKGLIVLANGFEDVEALGTVDILRRSRIDITTCGIDEEVVTQAGNKIKVDMLIRFVDKLDYDFLILPGGKAVFNELDKLSEVDEMIDWFYDNKKLICAICAAPWLIAKKGYFKDLNFTIFPGCLRQAVEGTNKKKEVVVEDNFITARSMYYTTDFALAIIEKLQGKEQRKLIEKQLMGLYK